MPRHPPFALKNLKSHEIESCNTPKGATKLTSEHAKQATRRQPNWRFTFCETGPKAPFLRCSRPLCSSQQTARTPTPDNPKSSSVKACKQPSPPPPKPGAGLSGPSGPNSVHAPASPDHTVPTPQAERTEYSRNQPAPMSMFHP
jgi:hypothetical protein